MARCTSTRACPPVDPPGTASECIPSHSCRRFPRLRARPGADGARYRCHCSLLVHTAIPRSLLTTHVALGALPSPIGRGVGGEVSLTNLRSDSARRCRAGPVTTVVPGRARLGDLDGRVHVGAAGDAGQQPSSRASRAAWRGPLRHGRYNARHSACGRARRARKPAPMPWMPCGPGAPPREHRRLGRLDRDDQHVPASFSFSTSPTPVMVPPVPTPATNASTVAAPVSSQDLLRRSCAGGPPGWPGCRTAGHEASPRSSASSSRGEDRAGHALRGRGEHELGAEAPKQLAPLDAHVFGHREHQPVALDGARPWPGRCRCCRWSARRSSSPGCEPARSSAASIIAAAMRSLTLPPGLRALELGEHGRRAAAVTRRAVPAACCRSVRASACEGALERHPPLVRYPRT